MRIVCDVVVSHLDGLSLKTIAPGQSVKYKIASLVLENNVPESVSTLCETDRFVMTYKAWMIPGM